jgi:4-amino-4-deoxy-L-arabinose transferase-like glycosyltransferase
MGCAPWLSGIRLIQAGSMPALRRLRVPPVVVLLAATAVLYLWGLSVSGWANAYYTAAVQAGAESWRAFFYGSFDAAGSVTVDKPPLALWPMALSVRIFGLSSWAVLAPQALMGVATVAVVHHAVRRATGSAQAALLAGAAMALTPVAVLMFRFNNPDGLLVLLLTSAAALTLRAVDAARDEATSGRRAGWWLVAAGALIGLAFLTKMLQAFLVLPALGLTYLLFAAVPWGRRVVHLLGAFAAMVVAGSWWVLAVELSPASSRPFIGGSQHNSAVELVLGYNGVGRLTGEQVGSVSTSSGWGSNTVFRLFDPDSGGQASWLLPAAVLMAVLALRLTRGATRGSGDDRTRPAIVLWLTWTLVTWLVFSLMAGIFHDYYTVALAPSIASLVGLTAHVAWQHRAEPVVTRTLGAAVALSGVVALVVLWPQRSWLPWLPWLVAALIGLALWRVVVAHRRAIPVGAGFASVAVLAAFAGPAAYSLETVSNPHTGAVPHAGPSRSGGGTPYGYATVLAPGSDVGDLLTASHASDALVDVLVRDAGSYTWVAAVTGANSAAGFQIATRQPVMPLGGFNGTDPAPTLPRFQQLVATGRVHWFIGGGGRLVSERSGEVLPVKRSGSVAAVRIERWVRRTFERTVVDGVVLFDLSPGTPATTPRRPVG